MTVHALPDAALPYNGHSTSPNTPSGDTRAWMDATGITAQQQRDVYELVAAAGPDGVTVAETRAAIPWNHHGSISGALSALHLKGHLALLVEKRQRCHIYVLPEHVRGRDTKPHTSNRHHNPAGTDLDNLAATLNRAAIPYRRRTAPGPIPTPPGVAPYDPALTGMFTILDVRSRTQPAPGGADRTTRMVFNDTGSLIAVWVF